MFQACFYPLFDRRMKCKCHNNQSVPIRILIFFLRPLVEKQNDDYSDVDVQIKSFCFFFLSHILFRRNSSRKPNLKAHCVIKQYFQSSNVNLGRRHATGDLLLHYFHYFWKSTWNTLFTLCESTRSVYCCFYSPFYTRLCSCSIGINKFIIMMKYLCVFSSSCMWPFFRLSRRV
jgi:hypothetical protein